MNRKASGSTWLARTSVRCLALVVAVVLLLAPLPWPQAPLVVPAASPYVGITTLLASRSLGAAAWVCTVVLFLAMVRRRWFCRWACPVGLMTEWAGRISPISPARCRPVPRVGIWLVLLSLSAAAVGYPLFVWLDPLAIFSGALGLVTDFSGAASQGTAALLAGILVLSFVLPGTWCLKLCPLGATQELLASPRLLLHRRSTGDDNRVPTIDVCTANEPRPASGTTGNGPNRWMDRVLLQANVNSDELIAEPMSRRSLLTTAVGATCAVAGVPLGLAARARDEGDAAATLRPPGAARPWQFGQLCVRCGNCVRACPSRIIRTQWRCNGWSDWLTPEVAFDSDYCREDCLACMEVCPSGAISAEPWGADRKPPIGLAQVLMDRCLLALGSECRTMCLDSCPYEAISLHPWTWEDDRRYPVIASQNCPGCGACQVACTPMDAIVVRGTS